MSVLRNQEEVYEHQKDKVKEERMAEKMKKLKLAHGAEREKRIAATKQRDKTLDQHHEIMRSIRYRGK